MKKRMIFLLACFFASTITVSASQELVKLESDHIYTKYDIDGDEQEDLFEYHRNGDTQTETLPVNLNNNKFDLETLSNASLYYFSCDKKPFLLATGYSGGAGSWIDAFRFTDGKFESMDAFPAIFTFTELDHADDEYIYCECRNEDDSYLSFETTAIPSCYVLYEFNPDSGSFEITSEYAEIKGQPEFEYEGNVPMITSTSAEDWNQDGPIVNNGDSVILLEFYLGDMKNHKYKTEVNGETCWFQEAEEYALASLE